jgi:CelD/BcsL family acetyltransferase involved in cellulose biosynthesis
MTTYLEDNPIRVFPGSLELRVQRGGLEVVDQLSDEWRALCAEAADDQPFFRPEFIRAHIQTVIPGATVLLITARQHGRLRLVLPLVEELGSFSKVPVRKLRAPVNFNCGRFDAVRHASIAGEAAVTATWQYLKELGGWDVLQFRDALQGSAVGRLAELAREDGFHTIQMPDRPNPYVSIPSDPEMLEQLPPNPKLRSQLRQARRRMADHGRLKFSRICNADPNALERFYQLEASGWKGQNGSDILHDGSRPFFDALAESAARFGYLSL